MVVSKNIAISDLRGLAKKFILTKGTFPPVNGYLALITCKQLSGAHSSLACIPGSNIGFIFLTPCILFKKRRFGSLQSLGGWGILPLTMIMVNKLLPDLS